MATDYATVSEFRNYTGMGTATAGTAFFDDTLIQLALDTAAVAINQFCSRDFSEAGTVASDRYLTADEDERYMRVPDFTGTLTLATDMDGDGTYELSVTDFSVVTRNNESVPWQEVRWGQTAIFSEAPDGIKATATWGWSAVPTPVSLACLIQASRFYKRREAPFGSWGSSDMGAGGVLPWKTTLDPDVQIMLQPYVNGWVAV